MYINCTIKLYTDNANNPDPERNSIYTFILISGFLCLIIPSIFLLLLIYSIVKSFKGFSRDIVRQYFVIVIIAYIAVCILIGIAQLAFSFYIASLIYPNFGHYMFDTKPIGEMIFECDPAIYLSAFVSVTVTYILIFILLAALVSWYIASKVKKYFATVVDEWFDHCLRAFKAKTTAVTTPRAGNNSPMFEGRLETQL